MVVVSEHLLQAIRVSGTSELYYVFCRVNADELTSLLAAHLHARALPFQTELLVAEVFGEILDQTLFGGSRDTASLYGAIPSIAESVVESAREDVQGFVPESCFGLPTSELANHLAARLVLPRELSGADARHDATNETALLAAQALLRLSLNDRRLLLAPVEPAVEPQAVSAVPLVAVADLLSRKAARRRFRDELDRTFRWFGHEPEPNAVQTTMPEELK